MMQNTQILPDPILFLRAQELKRQGISPYMKHFKRTHTLLEVNEGFEAVGHDYFDERTSITVCGRVREIRTKGNLRLVLIEDQDSRLQLVISNRVLDQACFELFETSVYHGDYLGFKLNRIIRIKGFVSGVVQEWCFLALANLPIPHRMGVKRQCFEREVYLASSLSAREKLIKHSQLVSYVRTFFKDQEIIEIPTPRQTTMANQNAASQTPPPHSYLKRIVVSGIEQVYEIVPTFFQGLNDWLNHPQALILHACLALKNLHEVMDLVEQLCLDLTQHFHAHNTVHWHPYEQMVATAVYQNQDDTIDQARLDNLSLLEIDLALPWVHRCKSHLIRDILGINFQTFVQLEDACDAAVQAGLSLEIAQSLTSIADIETTLFQQFVLPTLIQPTFVVASSETPCHHRQECTCAKHPEHFELYINGIHMATGWNESTDPTTRLTQENTDDLRFLLYGMLPFSNLQVHIDRIAMLMFGFTHIDDTICFPM